MQGFAGHGENMRFILSQWEATEGEWEERRCKTVYFFKKDHDLR